MWRSCSCVGENPREEQSMWAASVHSPHQHAERRDPCFQHLHCTRVEGESTRCDPIRHPSDPIKPPYERVTAPSSQSSSPISSNHQIAGVILWKHCSCAWESSGRQLTNGIFTSLAPDPNSKRRDALSFFAPACFVHFHVLLTTFDHA